MPIILTVLLTCLISLPAYGWTHMARTGENLEQLAVRYYGSSDRTTPIRAANGFRSEERRVGQEWPSLGTARRSPDA